ncbi:MAG: Copper amine oxidase protein [Cyanobacteria bacterium RYN_339]|nr:Copper amine oxidase protein [Cyanobacteria bacterium RYN_339]
MMLRSAFLAASLSLMTASPALSYTGHPLASLSGPEIEAGAKIFKADKRFPAGGIFAILDLEEAPKAQVLAWKPGKDNHRTVKTTIYSRKEHRTYEAHADLQTGKVLDWKAVDGVQPMVMMEEYPIATDAVRADKRWQEAMKKRGIKDLSKVGIDGWAAGPAFGSHRRVLRALSFYKGENQVYYSRPIEGVIGLVDLDTKEVIQLTDTGITKIADKGYDFDEKSTKGRPPLKPLIVTQPKGTDYTIKGNEVTWQGWHFTFSTHARDGLTLHQVGFEDHGKVRPILYRAGLSEMIVPYGDPDPNWNWRAAFDVGEYGFGNLGSPLEPGGDVPANATMFDAAYVDPQGKAYPFPKAVALWERDGGVVWKHYDYVSGANHVRRARELVLTTAAAVGNYDYLINWVFHQDGTLEMDAAATGMLLAKGTNQTVADAGACPGCTSHLVDKNILAPNHQHFFNWRLDFDIDGPNNSVYEMNQRALGKGDPNPNGNGFLMAETPLATESEAQRDLDPNANRKWRVLNPNVRNGLGNNTGYMLMPVDATPAYVSADSAARNRATFLNHNFWATRFKPDELYAAGVYPNQSASDAGLSRWANDGERIAGEDLVVWYTMGLSHAPREEEWPMMNATHVGFKLMPCGFFTSNPALDVPKQ